MGMPYTWQSKMRQWERNLDDHKYEIMKRLNIDEDRLMDVVDVLLEYNVIIDSVRR